MSKRFREIAKSFEKRKVYSVDEAIAILQACPPVKFDQSVEVALMLGVDPKKSDQIVRGTVLLPNGTGKDLRVMAFVRGDKIDQALAAGAAYAGSDEWIEKVKSGWTDFDAVVATPDMMREVGTLGKVLGPRGLMPTPKAGTVTTDIEMAITELKKGKVEFKVDRHGVINGIVGKLSFEKESLKENLTSFLQAIARAKPSSAKGQYMRSMSLSSTMGPGIQVVLDPASTTS